MKKKLNIIFFIDYDENTGLGHLNRCLHFLKYFPKNKATFVTKKKVNLKDIININNFDFSDINREEIYDIAVIDSYNISYFFEKKIKKISKRTICIDDLNYRNYNCDFLINYNPIVKKKYYEKKIGNKTCKLLGRKYNFIINYKKSDNSNLSNSKFNILIYFGTKDRTNFIKRKILYYIYKHKELINKITILSSYKFKYKGLNLSFFKSDNNNLVLKKIRKSDFCFLSTGVIVYEALSFNKIIFGKNISTNQTDNYNYLINSKKIQSLEKIKNFKFSMKEIQNLKNKNNFDDRYKGSIFKLIINPIIDKTGKKIHMEYFDNCYLRDIYKLQSKEFRRNYINTSSFSYKEHLNYFKNNENNNKFNTFIIKNERNFIGYIKTFDKVKKTEVSIAIKKEYQGKGIASNILKYLLKNNFFSKKPHAKINKKNIPSIYAFKNAGFQSIEYF